MHGPSCLSVAVTILGAITAIAGVTISTPSFADETPPSAKPPHGLATPVAVNPDTQTAANPDLWPGFRGEGHSRSAAPNLPLDWSPQSGIAWAVDLPGIGQSSPVVYRAGPGEPARVYVTATEGPNKQTLHVRCLALTDGQTLWTYSAPSSRPALATDYVAKAAPTPCADAAGVYALFESGDLIACDPAGRVRWHRKLCEDHGPFTNNHGLGSSPAQSPTALFVLVAQGANSYLLALDKATGRDVWKTPQSLEPSWSSALYLPPPATAPTTPPATGRVVISSNGCVAMFDASTGQALWRSDGLSGNTVASPSVIDQTTTPPAVVVGSSAPQGNLAIRLADDAPPDRTLWRAEGVTCSFGSPLVHNGAVFMVNRAGVAVCLHAATGTTLWTTRLAASCWASPLGWRDRVYFFTTSGVTEVYPAAQIVAGDSSPQQGQAPARLALNALPSTERILGIAAVGGAILIRQPSRLTCVGRPGPQP